MLELIAFVLAIIIVVAIHGAAIGMPKVRGAPPKTRASRATLRFSLRTLLIVVTAVAAFLGAMAWAANNFPATN